MHPENRPSQSDWPPYPRNKLLLGDPLAAPGTSKKKEQLQAVAAPATPPGNYRLAGNDFPDMERSSSSDRYPHSLGTDDGSRYSHLDGIGQSPAPRSSASDGAVNAELGGSKFTRRLGRRVKYPDAVNDLFEKSEIWTYFAPAAGLLMVVMSYYHNYGIISANCKENLILYLLGSMASLRLGKTLRNSLPELAVPAMVAADGLLIASFVIITLNALSGGWISWKHWLVYLLIIPCFLSTYVQCAYQIYKDDVREKSRIPIKPQSAL